MEAEADLEVVRPVSTGWIFIVSGGMFAIGPIVVLISVYLIDPTSAFGPLFLIVLAVVAFLGSWLTWVGWKMARRRKVMIILRPAEIVLGHMYTDVQTTVGWDDLAGLEIWRPHALHAGQRDQLSIGLTDAAAERLDLQDARPEPTGPGLTGGKWPFRKHFVFNAAHLSLSVDRIQAEVAEYLHAAGRQVDGPHIFHLGVVERKRWFFHGG